MSRSFLATVKVCALLVLVVAGVLLSGPAGGVSLDPALAPVAAHALGSSGPSTALIAGVIAAITAVGADLVMAGVVDPTRRGTMRGDVLAASRMSRRAARKLSWFRRRWER